MRAFLFACALPMLSLSAFADCPQLYPNGRPIASPGTVELCNSFYVVRYDTARRAVVLSAELIQPSDKRAKRTGGFRPDGRVSNSPVTGDYTRSGYDRGHMTPAGDSITTEDNKDTFLMTNMTPQAPLLNRGKWRILEEQTRDMINEIDEPTHVVTIALYTGNDPKIGPNADIPVPKGYYKVVYSDPPICFYAENRNDSDVMELPCVGINEAAGASLISAPGR